jgi:ribonuclease Z
VGAKEEAMQQLLYVLAGAALVIAIVAAGVYNSTAGQDALFSTAAKNQMGQSMAPVDGMRVVICGSASPLGNDPERAQACIAVITPEHFMLFDVGARSPQRINEARLPTSRLTGVFLTHFHSDHITGLPDINLASWVQGRKQSLKVYGPAGVNKVVGGFNDAYQLDRGYRTAHHGAELLPPAAGPMTPVAFEAGSVVLQDELIKVTSFAVEHPPIEPAVGYRVDYRGRSVVISGDTNAVDGLFDVAQGADLLLHDALSRTLLDPMIAVTKELNVPVMPTIMTDVIDYHADTTTLPARAADAGIRQLAFYHLVPVPGNALAEKMFLRDMPADVILVRDLHTFDLPAASNEILVTAP